MKKETNAHSVKMKPIIYALPTLFGGGYAVKSESLLVSIVTLIVIGLMVIIDRPLRESFKRSAAFIYSFMGVELIILFVPVLLVVSLSPGEFIKDMLLYSMFIFVFIIAFIFSRWHRKEILEESGWVVVENIK